MIGAGGSADASSTPSQEWVEGVQGLNPPFNKTYERQTLLSCVGTAMLYDSETWPVKGDVKEKYVNKNLFLKVSELCLMFLNLHKTDQDLQQYPFLPLNNLRYGVEVGTMNEGKLL